MGNFDKTVALDTKLKSVAAELIQFMTAKFMYCKFDEIGEVEEFDMSYLKAMYIHKTMKLDHNGIEKYCNKLSTIIPNFTKAVMCSGTKYTLEDITDEQVTGDLSDAINVSVYDHFTQILQLKYGTSATIFKYDGDESDEYKLAYGLFVIEVKDQLKLYNSVKELRSKLGITLEAREQQEAEMNRIILPPYFKR